MTDSADNRNEKGQPGVTRAALFGSCPCCGARSLWAGPAMLAPCCRCCGAAFAAHEPRGRTLYLFVLPVTVLLMVAAVRLDDALHPPLWLQALLWPPVVVLAVVGTLRLAKAAVLMARLRDTAKP